MNVLVPALFLIVGIAAGGVYFALLWRNVALFARGEAARALGMQLTRLLFITAVLGVAVWFGAPSLLACAAGIVVARLLALRRVGGTAR